MGTLKLEKNIRLYVYVGGQGIGLTQLQTTANGGYNGGGKASLYSSCSGPYYASGGGGSDMRIDVDSLYSRVIVAGGGGGGGWLQGSDGNYVGVGGGLSRN